jgi:hypothetical protein
MERMFLLTSALEPRAAARVAAEFPHAIDLVSGARLRSRGRRRRSPSAGAGFSPSRSHCSRRVCRERAASDVLGRLAEALRGLQAFEAKAPLVVLDGLDVFGAGVFVLDEEGVMRCADDLERLRPPP